MKVAVYAWEEGETGKTRKVIDDIRDYRRGMCTSERLSAETLRLNANAVDAFLSERGGRRGPFIGRIDAAIGAVFSGRCPVLRRFHAPVGFEETRKGRYLEGLIVSSARLSPQQEEEVNRMCIEYFAGRMNLDDNYTFEID